MEGIGTLLNLTVLTVLAQLAILPQRVPNALSLSKEQAAAAVVTSKPAPAKPT